MPKMPKMPPISRRIILLIAICQSVVKQNTYVNSFTITTFNMLAAVHRSMDTDNRRESERREWWEPRAESVAKFVADELVRYPLIFVLSNCICLG